MIQMNSLWPVIVAKCFYYAKDTWIGMLQTEGICVMFCSQQPGVASAAWDISLTFMLGKKNV